MKRVIQKKVTINPMKDVGEEFMRMIRGNDYALEVFYHKLILLHAELINFYAALKNFGAEVKYPQLVSLAAGRLAAVKGQVPTEFPLNVMSYVFVMPDGKDPSIEVCSYNRSILTNLMKDGFPISFIAQMQDYASLLLDVKENIELTISDKMISNLERMLFSITYFTPFETLPNFNLTDKWNTLCTDKNTRVHFIFQLQALLKQAYVVNKTMMIPDIDPSKIEFVLTRALEEHKKAPQLQGCEKAFAGLIGSTQLLRNNFDYYYTLYVKSGNIMSIFDAYFQDLAKQQNEDTPEGRKKSMQTKKIMDYFVGLMKQSVPNNASQRTTSIISSLSNMEMASE